MPPVPRGAGWLTYVRCHDDIGWAITEEDAGAVGESGHLHRRFLADFYAGDFAGSFARGARFQPEPNGEARTSGTAAALAGLEAAVEAGDEAEIDLAVRRLLLLHALAFSHAGLPLLYMGDEIGLRNDVEWREDPLRSDDNRWMHRPRMDWEAAERRHDLASVEGRLWQGLRRLGEARKASPAMHAQGRSEPLWTGNDRVFGLLREHAGHRLLVLANVTEHEQRVGVGLAYEHGVAPRPGDAGRLEGEDLVLVPYGCAWLTS
jgi:amylosucrase